MAFTTAANLQNLIATFMQFQIGVDKDVTPYDPIEPYHDMYNGGVPGLMYGSWVTDQDGKKIGIASGRTYAFHEQRMISLASIEKDYAIEGKDLIVLWGRSQYPVKRIRAKVAPFPYYNEEYRNETFDVEKIPRLAKQ